MLTKKNVFVSMMIILVLNSGCSEKKSKFQNDSRMTAHKKELEYKDLKRDLMLHKDIIAKMKTRALSFKKLDKKALKLFGLSHLTPKQVEKLKKKLVPLMDLLVLQIEEIKKLVSATEKKIEIKNKIDEAIFLISTDKPIEKVLATAKKIEVILTTYRKKRGKRSTL